MKISIRDQHNDDAVGNSVLTCSRWEGGQFWLEDADDDIFLENGLRDCVIPIQPTTSFNGYILRKIMPWIGCRTVLVDFRIRDMRKLSAEEIIDLQHMGFVLRNSIES